MALAIFLLEFEHVRIQEDVKTEYIMAINEMRMKKSEFLFVNILLFVANCVLLSHLVSWQKYLEKSWCSLNFFARENSDKGKYKF